jgi:GntR family transcriptional regulator, transcriptional repressor for pyruvate dehydrogenase complex
MLIPLKRRRFTDRIVEQLQEFLLDRHLQPGDKLPPDSELAQTFSVSRGTIREALHLLEHDGLVRIKKGPGGGIFVNEGNFFQVIEAVSYAMRREQVSFDELLEARRSIEDRIARMAALRATQKDLEEMARILERMEKLEGDQALFVRYDTDFHLCLARAAKNKILLMYMVALKEIHNRVISRVRLRGDLFPSALRYHSKIYEAVRKRNPEKASRVMIDHLENFEKRFREQMREEKLGTRVVGF